MTTQDKVFKLVAKSVEKDQQINTSKIAEKIGMSIDAVRYSLRTLADDGLISLKTKNRRYVIKLK